MFPEWLDSPAEAVTALALVGTLFAALSWLIRAQIAQERELKPNHGSSLRDAIDRIERNQETFYSEMRQDLRDVRSNIGAVHDRVDSHLNDHAKGF